MVWYCGIHEKHSIDDVCSECVAEYRVKEAAPDLLKALQLVVKYYPRGAPRLHLEMARAAIAKATGE